jgi:hypothetical protein
MQTGVHGSLLRRSGTAEIRAKIGHRHWPKSRGFGHANSNVGKRRLSSPFDYDGQRGFWPGQKEKGIANYQINKAIVPLCPKMTRISAIPDLTRRSILINLRRHEVVTRREHRLNE